ANQTRVLHRQRQRGCHGEGLLEGLAGACGFDGRGGRKPARGRAYSPSCSLDGGALARSEGENRQRRGETGHRVQPPLKAYEQWLLDLLAMEPDLTLEEIRDRLRRPRQACCQPAQALPR